MKSKEEFLKEVDDSFLNLVKPFMDDDGNFPGHLIHQATNNNIRYLIEAVLDVRDELVKSNEFLNSIESDVGGL